MNTAKRLENVLSRLLQLALVTLLFQPFRAAADEETFSVLQIGTATYRNVTVTGKAKDCIFILHSRGITSVKIQDLPQDLRTKLGYEVPAAPQPKTTPAAWATQTFSKIQVPQARQLQERVTSWWHFDSPEAKTRLPRMSQNILLLAAGVSVAFYFFYCYCCMLICRKAGYEPGVLVWVPMFQLVPLLKAAGMSPWWLLGFVVPGFNLVAQVVWCIKITRARGKTALVALLLIFPLSSPLAVLYLAFSGGTPARKKERRVEIMTLEAA